MTHGLSHRLKRLEKNVSPIKTLDDLLDSLNNQQLRHFITLKDTRNPVEISEAFGWDIKKAESFISDLTKAPTPKEFARLSTEDLVEIIVGENRPV